MTFAATISRPFARAGVGSDWRGALTSFAWSSVVAAETIVYRSMQPGTPAPFKLAGVTRDSAGNPLANCRVELFLTAGDVSQQAVTSDSTGNFRFDVQVTGPFYIVAYKAGSPDVSGTTLNTLSAT